MRIEDYDYRVGDIVQVKHYENGGKLGKIERIEPAIGKRPFLIYAVRTEYDDRIEYIMAADWQIRFVSREE